MDLNAYTVSLGAAMAGDFPQSASDSPQIEPYYRPMKDVSNGTHYKGRRNKYHASENYRAERIKQRKRNRAAEKAARKARHK